MGETNSSRRGRRLSYANVMSTLAVFLVLAGGTALATGLRRDSVGSRAVRDNSLQSADLRNGAGVTGADVADSSLSGADVAEGSLSGADVADNSLKGADTADGSVGRADLGLGAVGTSNIAANAVNSSSLLDGSVQGADIGTATVSGANIVESTLFQVPDTAKLAGKTPEDFLSSGVLAAREIGPLTGSPLGDGTFKLSAECAAGEVLLAGGPSGVEPGTNVVEDGPEAESNGRQRWSVVINPHGAADPFSVVVLCDQPLR